MKDGFEDPVKRMLYRAEGAYPREHLESLEQIQLHLLPGIDNLAEQIISSGSVASIRKPPRARSTRTSRVSHASRTTDSGSAKVSEMPSVYTEDLDAITY